MEQEKRHDPNDTTLRFVDRPDDILLDDDPNTQRIEMPCGHAVTPQSLTAYCRSLLDQGQYKFLCPALKNGTNNKCGAEWKYVEVRRIALLTEEEQNHFEKTMAELAAAMYCEYNSCPGCSSYIERQKLTNLCVRCTICTAESGKCYEFCWQCLKTWKGPAPRSDKCENDSCVNLKLEKLLKCKDTILPELSITTVRALQCLGEDIARPKYCKPHQPAKPSSSSSSSGFSNSGSVLII
ncbi:hypothetical protein KOW79_006483 [Hemibagrus wyckioides]|uniref:RING-type domain-containing protein n=1 Tax=Hemibagrus wyckioides TaxID=337641 RepID=A0A9D3SMJ1_9TELE|nr:hypothetical protein KOW79_006483 [Hemibagrus wyckioides]